MKKFALLAALALISLSTTGVFAQATSPANRVTVNLTEQNGSGQNGTAVIEEMNGQLMVTVNVTGGSDVPQPAHIHRGTCANLDPRPAFPLTSLVNGKSDTTVATTMAELSAGTYAINIHKSPTEASVYVSCGDIVNMALTGGGTGTGTGTGTETGVISESGTTVGMPRTGNGDNILLIGALVMLAVSMIGTGAKLARRKIQ